MNTSRPLCHRPRRFGLKSTRRAALGIVCVFAFALGCDESTVAADAGPQRDAGTDGGMQPEAGVDEGTPDTDIPPDAAAPADAAPGEGDQSLVERAALGAGAAHTCFADADGTLRCWGEHDDGQLGGPEDAPFPVIVALDGVRRVAAYGETTCAVDGSGNGSCFGRVVPGEPMDGVRHDMPVPVPGGRVSALVPGQTHGCALGFDAAVRCWGDNQLGQLGTGATPDALEGSADPLPVAGLPPAVSIAVGASHACARLEDATVWCWGASFAGQLGRSIEDEIFDPSPAAVDFAGALAIDAGGTGTCAVLDGGELWCWGGVAGQGFGATPTRISDMAGFSAVAIGLEHACALREGAVWCWGENGRRQLGRDGEGASDPQRVEWLEPAVSITAGAHHTCAELHDGSVACWGANRDGQANVPGVLGPDIDIDLRWDDDGLDVALDGPALNWQFGMAETDAGGQGWTGESCGGESMFDVDVCHTLGPAGGRITSVHPDLDRVADGFTLFDASFAPALTYILRAEDGFQCIAWGHDPGYYAELGCVLR